MSDTFADHASETTEVATVIAEDGSITVGERKFSGLEDLTKSFVNAQSHIQTIESENAKQREALTKAKGVDDVLAKLQEQQSTSESQPTSDQSTTTEPQGVITEDKLDALIEQRLTDRQIAEREDANVNQAMKVAKDTYGDSFVTQLSSKAAELGMSEQDAIAIARRSSDAFTKLFVGESKPLPSNTSGDINSQAIQGRPAEKPSAKLRLGATSSELLSAWKASAPIE